MLVLFLGVVAAVAVFYYYFVKPMNYWKDRGVEHGNPKWFFGHIRNFSIGRENGCKIIDDVYKQSPHARYTGMYRFSTPVFMVRDPELLKRITVKDFDSFMDHPAITLSEADPLWSKNLLSLTGSKWRDMRVFLSPSFTSSKMRIMFAPMTECAEILVQHILKTDEETLTINVKDLFSRYTNDVIATTTFGVKVESLVQPNNEFYQISKELMGLVTFQRTIKLLLNWLIPAVMKFTKPRFITNDADKYFRGLIDNTIKEREEKGIVRPDMLHLLLQARNNLRENRNGCTKEPNGSEKEDTSNVTLDISNEDITAQALIFLIGGFESVSIFISYTTYELALRPDVQEKLRQEIRATKENCGGKVTYEAILDMKYMDMVMSESMRKWPHFAYTDRECTKPYTIDPVTTDEKPVHLETGIEVMIPISSIHHDPKYYPDPERFDPERFSDENRGKILPYTYFPFGLGPRACLGSRFALLQSKILLFHLLSHFELVPVKRTMIPLKFRTAPITSLKPVGGFWLGIRRCKE